MQQALSTLAGLRQVKLREHSTGASLAEEGELHTPVAHEQALGLLQLQAEPGVQPALGTGGAELAS